MSKDTNIKVHSVKYNFMMNSILKMSSFLFPLITFPYVSRVLGADGNGKVAFASSVVYYFTTFAALGVPTYGIRKCAQCRDDRDRLSRTVHELLMFSTAMSILSYLILTLCILTVPKLQENSQVLWVFSASVLLNGLGVEWFYQAIEQYGYITYRNLAFKVLSVFLMFLLVKTPEDYILYAGISVLATVGSNILNFLRLRKYIVVGYLGEYQILRHIRPSLTFFFLTIATTVYTNLDTIMLGFMQGDAQVGYYNAATKTKSVLLSLVTAVGTVLLPRVSYYIEKGQKEEFKGVIGKSVQIVCLLAVPLTLFFSIEADQAILFLAGRGYENAVLPMRIIMPTILLIGLSNITGIQILVPLNREKNTIVSTVCGAVINLILNTVCIPRYGAAGAAFGTVAAELTVFAVQIWYLRNTDYFQVKKRELGKVLMAAAGGSMGLCVYRYFTEVQTVFADLCFAAAVFFGIYLFLLLCLKEDMMRYYLIGALKLRKEKKR